MLNYKFKTLLQALLILIIIGVFGFVLYQFAMIYKIATIDIVVALFTIVWIIFITTVPWNAYFKAQSVLDEAAISRSKNIQINESKIKLVKKISKYGLVVSIGLHILSGFLLYLIYYFNVTPIGIYASVLVILFTFLRPSIFFYNFLQDKLNQIKTEFIYPREDVNALIGRVNDLEYCTKMNVKQLDREIKDSLANKVDTNFDLLKTTIGELNTHISNVEEKFNQRELSSIDNATFLESIKNISSFLRK